MPTKAQTFDAALQYLRSKVPQRGMFSTLDELVRAAPFEQAPAEQWQNFLKPGQTLTREGVNFPLKKEELDYSGLPDFLQGALNARRTGAAPTPFSKEALLEQLQASRPEFGLQIQTDDSDILPRIARDNRTTLGPPAYSEHAHIEGVPNSYEENITTSPSFGSFPSHFSPQDLSWSRTTRHPVGDAQNSLARLVEEIQSDRHEAAAERSIVPQDERAYEEGTNLTTVPGPRRGYRTLEDLSDYHKASAKPPDTPFKNPEDYAGLELRKQLLNSVNQGDSYLALTRGADQVERYEQGMGGGKGQGMSYVYDTIYPKALKKLAAQYGAKVQDISIPMEQQKMERPQVFVDAGAENLDDLHSYLENFEDSPETALDTYRTAAHQLYAGLPEKTENMQRNYANALNHFNEAQRHQNLRDYPLEELTPEQMNQLDYQNKQHYHSGLGYLDNLWAEWQAQKGETSQVTKTFPAMEITPEVADRVRKAGVPLWSLGAGAAAAGLGAYKNEAQANPVEDAAMQNANGYAAGGSVTMPHIFDPVALVQAAKSRHYAYKPLGQSSVTGGQDYTPSILQGRNITQNPAAAAALAAQGVKGANKPQPMGRPSSPLNPVEPTANGQLLPGFADGGAVLSKVSKFIQSLIDRFGSKTVPGVTNDAEHLDLLKRYQNGQLSLDDANRLIGSLSRAPTEAQAMGNSVHPMTSPSVPEAQLRLRRAASQNDPASGVDPYNTADAAAAKAQNDQLLSDALSEGHADGGSVDDSSLRWVADTARKLGIKDTAEDRARVATGIAKQFYGLDENGNPVLGGHAWLSSQHGTPPRILDEMASLPGGLIRLVNTLNGPGPKGTSDLQPPKWSDDAAARIEALDKKVKGVTGVGDPHSLAEHVEDAAGTLATPFPASKVAGEAPAIQRAFEYLAPVRPPTLGRYATDSAALGGFSTALDRLVSRLAARRLAPTPSPPDTTIEDAAMENANAMGQ